ncbi:hypothetical protein Misp06_04359 [Microbulbifer sp. NBRC 101763]
MILAVVFSSGEGVPLVRKPELKSHGLHLQKVPPNLLI